MINLNKRWEEIVAFYNKHAEPIFIFLLFAVLMLLMFTVSDGDQSKSRQKIKEEVKLEEVSRKQMKEQTNKGTKR